MDHTFTCFACTGDVPPAMAKCYRDWSFSHGLRPYCTYDGCSGVMTHLGTAGRCRARRRNGATPRMDDNDHDISDHSELALLQYCGQVLVLGLVLTLVLALVIGACMAL